VVALQVHIPVNIYTLRTILNTKWRSIRLQIPANLNIVTTGCFVVLLQQIVPTYNVTILHSISNKMCVSSYKEAVQERNDEKIWAPALLVIINFLVYQRKLGSK